MIHKYGFSAVTMYVYCQVTVIYILHLVAVLVISPCIALTELILYHRQAFAMPNQTWLREL